MNVVPTPTTLSAEIVPPKSSIDFLAMESPNPARIINLPTVR